jgi:hypothetical protein
MQRVLGRRVIFGSLRAFSTSAVTLEMFYVVCQFTKRSVYILESQREGCVTGRFWRNWTAYGTPS